MNNFSLHYADNKLWYGTFAHFTAAGIKHGISTRLGGVSSAPYATLNLGLRTDDVYTHVVANRRLFCQALGIDPHHVVTCRQVHGDKVVSVTAAMKGQGMWVYDTAVPAADGMVTNEPGVALMQSFADCVPVLLADPRRHVVAICHAGWRGTVAKVAQKTALFMQHTYGSSLTHCLVGIGPSIGPCCYEVDETVAREVRRQFGAWQKLLIPHGTDKWLLDLWQANREQLQEIGIPSENIQTSGVCTACNVTLYFSHRREKGLTGRIGALIAL